MKLRDQEEIEQELKEWQNYKELSTEEGSTKALWVKSYIRVLEWTLGLRDEVV